MAKYFTLQANSDQLLLVSPVLRSLQLNLGSVRKTACLTMYSMAWEGVVPQSWPNIGHSRLTISGLSDDLLTKSALTKSGLPQISAVYLGYISHLVLNLKCGDVCLVVSNFSNQVLSFWSKEDSEFEIPNVEELTPTVLYSPFMPSPKGYITGTIQTY